jgi:DNA polymerase-1
VAVVFDPEGGSFRQKDFPEYKAHRPPMPEELSMQWPRIREITRAFNFSLICVDNFEADDVIATLARQAERRGWKVTIVSSDKDLMQLISNRIQMLDTMKSIHFDEEAVRKRWGVGPDQIVDLFALAGDSSDNIPGVPGIGPKTAAQLLKDYGNLDNLLREANTIPQKKRREMLQRHADDARLSHHLVRLREDVPLPVGLDDLAIKEPDRDKLKTLFRELEFRRLLTEFSNGGDAETKDRGPGAKRKRIDRLVTDEGSLQSLTEALRNAPLIAIDTETTSLNCHDADLVGLSFSVREGEGWYVPVGHKETGERFHQLDKEKTLAILKPILVDRYMKKCGHNLKYDLQVLRRAGIELAGIRYDSMLLAYCLYPGKYPPRLDTIAQDYLDYTCIPYESVAGKGNRQIRFDEVPIEKALPYASEDAEVAYRLTLKLSGMLAEQKRQHRHDEIELPLLTVLADMEWIGAKLDKQMLHGLSREFGRKIAKLETTIHHEAGVSFNIHSPQQLGSVLFEHLKLPGGKRTKGGQWSTAQEILESLSEVHPVARLILRTRQLAKLKSTYTDALQNLIHPETGRVHTSYNQAITTTGRLSSSDPNLQNIPIRTEEGREIRKAFIAERDCILISADYSQIELRLMAHFSGDEHLIAAFEQGLDIHAATAAVVNQVPLNEVTSSQRRHAKIINFGILYGMSAFGLAKQLGVDRSQAQRFIDSYFSQYPRVRSFMDQTLERARKQGYVETLMGHRVFVPEIHARNTMRRQYAERTAINAPLQGSAADIIKVAMIRLHERLKKEVPEAHMILQVHDELVVEAPMSLADQVSTIMREEMQTAVKLHVPLTVDLGTGRNWYEAHRL